MRQLRSLAGGRPLRPAEPPSAVGTLLRLARLEGLAAAHAAGRLVFFGDLAGLKDARASVRHLKPLRKKECFVYAKPPFAGPKAVLAYLGRYTHRDAIANSRLVAATDEGVTFRVMDYRCHGRERVETFEHGHRPRAPPACAPGLRAAAS